MFLLLNRLFNNNVSGATTKIKHRKNELWWDKEWALNLNGELENYEEARMTILCGSTRSKYASLFAFYFLTAPFTLMKSTNIIKPIQNHSNFVISFMKTSHTSWYNETKKYKKKALSEWFYPTAM
jgi:hypothetical protein